MYKRESDSALGNASFRPRVRPLLVLLVRKEPRMRGPVEVGKRPPPGLAGAALTVTPSLSQWELVFPGRDNRPAALAATAKRRCSLDGPVDRGRLLTCKA